MTAAGAWTSRYYQAEPDYEQMRDLLIQARLRTGDWRYAHVGELAWDFFMVACHLSPKEHVRLWHNAQSKLIGYAVLGEDSSFNLQVLPEYAESGIDSEALAWVEDRLKILRAQDAQRWAGKLVSGARQDNSKRIAFLERNGFRRGEYAEVNLLRPLEVAIPDSVPPAGFSIRAVAASPEEISDRAAAQHDVWQPWSVGNIGGGDYARLMSLPGYNRELDVVAVAPDGAVAAYTNGWLDPLNRIGDFGPVGARPAYRRRGLARAVLLEGLRRMRARGMDRACVSTGVANAPALRLYESIGFAIVNKYFDFVKTE